MNGFELPTFEVQPLAVEVAVIDLKLEGGFHVGACREWALCYLRPMGICFKFRPVKKQPRHMLSEFHYAPLSRLPLPHPTMLPTA